MTIVLNCTNFNNIIVVQRNTDHAKRFCLDTSPLDLGYSSSCHSFSSFLHTYTYNDSHVQQHTPVHWNLLAWGFWRVSAAPPRCPLWSTSTTTNHARSWQACGQRVDFSGAHFIRKVGWRCVIGGKLWVMSWGIIKLLRSIILCPPGPRAQDWFAFACCYQHKQFHAAKQKDEKLRATTSQYLGLGSF